MFSGCPSVCACVLELWHSPTVLPSTARPSLFQLTLWRIYSLATL